MKIPISLLLLFLTYSLSFQFLKVKRPRLEILTELVLFGEVEEEKEEEE